jgi:hypothetical protein
MSLDLPKLLPQVQQLSQSLLKQQAQRAQLLERALSAYQGLLALPPEELETRLARVGSRWTGARPAQESLGTSVAPPEPVPDLNVIGADGSQIYPDRHARVFFFLINLAGILIQHDCQSAPETRTESQLFFEPEQLRYESDQPVESAWVNLQRDLGEMMTLADMCEEVHDGAVLALLDNSLLLWMVLQARAAGERELDRILKAYFEAMNRLQTCGAALAGIIDRPRSSNVLALAALANQDVETIGADDSARVPFPGLTDRELFAHLLPEGHRSACFDLISPLNRDFHAVGQGIHFFYLHLPGNQILRVEIPAWVAGDRARLDRVHAGLLRESLSTNGYPYALIRAHELAVVTQAERLMVEEWIGRELATQGMLPTLSRKAFAKTQTSSGRRPR